MLNFLERIKDFVVKFKVPIIMGLFICAYLWILQPAISTIAKAITSLPTYKTGFQKCSETILSYFPTHIFDGCLTVPYFDSFAIPGYIILIIILVYLFKSAINPGVLPNDIIDAQPEMAGNNEYGNTTFIRTLREVKQQTNLSIVPVKQLGKTKPGFYLGSFGNKLVMQQYSGHVLVLAPTRAGKTRRILFILIYELLKSNASLVVFDPKGELYGIMAEPATKLNIPINRINFSLPHTGNRINPLYHVIEQYQAKDKEGLAVNNLINKIEKLKEKYYNTAKTERDPILAQIKKYSISLSKRLSRADHEVKRIVDALVQRDEEKESSGATFFINGGCSLLEMTIHYVCCKNGVPDDARTLERVYVLLKEFCQPVSLNMKNPKDTRWFSPLIEDILKMNSQYPCYKKALEVQNESKNYVKDFIGNATQYISIYAGYDIAQMMSETDFTYEELTEKQTITFINTSLKESVYKDLALFYIENLYSSLVAKAELNGNKLERKIFIVAEELTQLPVIPDLAGRLNSCTSYGIQWILIAQSINMMFATYGRDVTLNILENCSTQIFLGSNSTETSRYVSSMFGTYTIEEKTSSVSKTPNSMFSNSVSEGSRLLKRDRITPSEVQKWEPDQGVLISVKGCNPLVIPAPQAEKTLFRGIIGLGSEEWEKEKIRKWTNAKAHEEEVLLSDWTPELNKEGSQGRLYTDEQRKQKRAKYIADLFERSKNRQSLKKDDEENKNGNSNKENSNKNNKKKNSNSSQNKKEERLPY